MDLKKDMMKRAAVLTAAAVMLSGNASALFGLGKGTEAPAEGAPIAQELEIVTYRGVPYQGQLQAADLEGEDITFALAEEPRKGVVEIDGVNFTYTPHDRQSGNDRFTYTATDSEGNTSAPAVVNVRIEKVRSGVMYADTNDSVAAIAAQWMAEEGIFTGAQIGSQYYFEPDRPVSRSEFLAMAMETAGREVTSVTMTGFCDDAVIPTWAKAYASAGVAEGIVQGSVTEGGAAFRGEDAITYSEAATIMNRLLQMEDVDLEIFFAGREAVPSWAAQAVGNLEAANVMAAGSFGSAELEKTVSRADAAQMLAAMSVWCEEK